MDIATMTYDEACEELDRILGFRSLSTADWQRVQRLQLRIALLERDAA